MSKMLPIIGLAIGAWALLRKGNALANLQVGVSGVDLASLAPPALRVMLSINNPRNTAVTIYSIAGNFDLRGQPGTAQVSTNSTVKIEALGTANYPITFTLNAASLVGLILTGQTKLADWKANGLQPVLSLKVNTSIGIVPATILL